MTKHRINELTYIMDAHTAKYLTHKTSETLKELYFLILTRQQEQEKRAQQKKAFIYHMKHHNSQNLKGLFIKCLT